MSIKERAQVLPENTWRLEDIFENETLWEKDFSKAQDQIKALEHYQGRLGESAQTLKEALDAQSTLSLNVERLYVYAGMRRDQDNANAQYQAMADRAMNLIVQASAAMSFYQPEILAIDEKTFDQWRQSETLLLYSHMLDDMARARKHTLSKEEERIIAMSSEIGASPQNIYKMLDYADLTFPKVKTKDGEQQLTHGNYIHLMESDSRQERKETFEAFYKTYEQFQNTYATTLASSNKKDVFFSTVRRFPSAMEASLFNDQVSPDVYEQLIKAVHTRLPLLHRYVSLRKKALNLDEIHMYDLYVPLSKNRIKVPFEQAKKMVIEGLAPLGNEYIQTLQEAFDKRWIDIYENKGKTTGAYSWGAYGTHPYVLMNYEENIDSVFTLAHEMGHAMHSYYSDKTQPYVKAQYTILVAEVASTVNESLLIEHLMATEKDQETLRYLVNYYLDQFRGTVFRQVMFAEFEKWTHEQIQSGQALTAEAIKEKYLDLNRQYYGPDMVVDDLIGYEWARISHFYNAFYVYKYATGFSSAVAISRAIRQNQEGALKKYMNFLCSGGSDYPLELLKNAGVDLNKPEPVENALDVFGKTLDRLEGLL